jgi:hypothetical protein
MIAPRAIRGSRRRSTHVLGALALAAVAATPPPVQAAPARLPDLAPAAVAIAPAVVAGQQLGGTVRVNRTGSTRRVASVTVAIGPVGSKRPTVLARLTVPAGTGPVTRSISLDVPANAAVGARLALTVCVDPAKAVRERNERNNCRTSAAMQVRASLVSSTSLVAAAKAAGTITAEQAIVDGVLARFGSPALPAALRGDGVADGESDAIDAATRAWPTLSERARATLLPYLVPPATQGSWANGHVPSLAAAFGHTRRAAPAAAPCAEAAAEVLGRLAPGWKGIPAAGGLAKVWYRPGLGQAAQAASYAREISRTIWPTFSSYLGREPPADDTLAGSPNRCYHGDSDAFDVYIQRLGNVVVDEKNNVTRVLPISTGKKTPTQGINVRYLDCARSPSFVLIQPGQSRDVLAHEVFHAFQAAFDYGACRGVDAVTEGTATWAEDLAYKNDQDEHSYPVFTGYSLMEPAPASGPSPHYLAWGFFRFLSQRSKSIVRSILLGGETLGSAPLATIDAVAGTWETQLPLFALKVINKDPINDSFKQWDAFAVQPVPVGLPVQLVGDSYRLENTHTGPLPPLAFSNMSISAYPPGPIPPNVRMIRISNPAYGKPWLHVRALVKTASGWAPDPGEDWSDRESFTFCRDTPAENISDLILSFSDTDWTAPWPADPNAATLPVKIETWDSCLPDRFVGTFSGSSTQTGLGTTTTATWNGAMSMFRVPSPVGITSYTQEANGTATVHLRIVGVDCTLVGSGTVLLGVIPGFPGPAPSVLGIVTALDPPTYTLTAAAFAPITVTSESCANPADNGVSTQYPTASIALLSTPTPVEYRAGNPLVGTQSRDVGGTSSTWTWHFDPADPLPPRARR